MRKDAVGLFWQDVPKDNSRPVPPDPVWLSPDYLPGIDEVLRTQLPLMSDSEIIDAFNNRERLVFDIECYRNYFLVAFMSLSSGRVFYEEFQFGNSQTFNWDKVVWVLSNFLVVGFNSNHYDLPMVSCAIDGMDTDQLSDLSNELITSGEQAYQILKGHKVKQIKCNSIDIMEVAPLRASLKIYGGRLHSQRMQNLPFDPKTELSQNQILILRHYCINDLRVTADLYYCLKGEIALRESMSLEYGVDLRSKSDAQVAEAVITTALQRQTGVRPTVPNIPDGTTYQYRVPDYLDFKTDILKHVLYTVRNTNLVVATHGGINLPQSIADLKIRIGQTDYTMKIGGLHSCEKACHHKSDDDYQLYDYDVESYYPAIILNQALAPRHLGTTFLNVYRGIVQRRLAAKAAGNKQVSDSLKITINGSFGKFGSMYSILYAPDLLIQVTLSGQLSLLMLIESLELAGISVVSANTDGVVIKCPRRLTSQMRDIIGDWQARTQFKMESVEYQALYSRDVNNYIAIKADGSAKKKGTYADPWKDPKSGAMRLHKNPAASICSEAVEAFLARSVPISETINGCTDFTRFVVVRSAKSGTGAAKGGEFLGKALRWYYAKGTLGNIVYADSGHQIPKSEGAKPVMQLPDNIPADLDRDWYVREAEGMLKDFGL